MFFFLTYANVLKIFFKFFSIMNFFPLIEQDHSADLIGGDAIPLSELDTYHPEEGTVLANTTSVGLHPKNNETPIFKVCLGCLTIFSRI